MKQRNRKDLDTGQFKSSGEFFKTVQKVCLGLSHDSRLKTMTEGDDAAGGFLLPEAWRDELLYVAVENSIVRRSAIVVPMPSDEITIPVVIDTTHASVIFGGAQHQWIREAAAKDESDADLTFGNITLTAHKAVILALASNELERDVPRFGFYITDILGRAMGHYQDWQFTYGTGAGRPLGVFRSAALIEEARSVPSKLTMADFGHLARRLLVRSWEKAEWIVNNDTIGEMFELASSRANPTSVIDLSRRRIFDCPITPSELAQALGSTGDVSLVDFSHYVIGERELGVSYSPHAPGYFEKDMGVWKIVARYDGQPILNSPITPHLGANTLSPFVTLSAAS
jgi:HK97 family phage major capsid protein